MGEPPYHRLGVAQVAAANIAEPESRAWSEMMLRVRFDDDDADVRREAASCFGRLRDETIGTCLAHETCLRIWLRTPSPPQLPLDNASDGAHGLQRMNKMDENDLAR